MRFLRLFLLYLLSAFVIVGGGFILFREGLLLLGSRQIVNDVKFLMRTNEWQSLASKCYDGESVGAAAQLQLRFLNDTDYALEIGCDNYKYIEFQRKSLPFSIRKTTGTAGFIYNLKSERVSGEITLSFLNQNRVVSVQDQELTNDWGESTEISDDLITSCEAHGYVCCDQALEQGQGEVFRNGVNDCQDECFSSCRTRPNLILFESDPLMVDPVARRVEVSKTVSTVFFQYAFEKGADPIQEVLIEYGDGTQETSASPRGEFIKEYACSQESCSYQARIVARDTTGTTSFVSRIAEVDVLLLER